MEEELGVEEPRSARSRLFTNSLRAAKTRHGMCITGTILFGFGLVITGAIMMSLTSNHQKKSMLQSIKDKEVDPLSLSGPAVLIVGSLVMVFGFITCVCFSRKRRNSDERPILEESNPETIVASQQMSTPLPSTSNYGSIHVEADVHTTHTTLIDETKTAKLEDNAAKSPQEVPKIPPPVSKKSKNTSKPSDSLNQHRKDQGTLKKVIEEPELTTVQQLEGALLDKPTATSQIQNANLETVVSTETQNAQEQSSITLVNEVPHLDSPSSNIPPVGKLIERFESKATNLPPVNRTEVDGPMTEVDDSAKEDQSHDITVEDGSTNTVDKRTTQTQEESAPLTVERQTPEPGVRESDAPDMLATEPKDELKTSNNVVLSSQEQTDASEVHSEKVLGSSPKIKVEEAPPISDDTSKPTISTDCETPNYTEDNHPTSETKDTEISIAVAETKEDNA